MSEKIPRQYHIQVLRLAVGNLHGDWSAVHDLARRVCTGHNLAGRVCTAPQMELRAPIQHWNRNKTKNNAFPLLLQKCMKLHEDTCTDMRRAGSSPV